MANISQKPKKIPPLLDTLAQPDTFSQKTLQKRARSKWYTIAIVSRLKYLTETKLKKYYSHAWNCNYKIYQDGKKLTSRYCNTRVCHICTRIRTAKLMNGYVDQLLNLGELEFVTLTVRNCKADELSTLVDQMIKAIIRIIATYRKSGIKISGVRKLEITYNSFNDTYHPHLHILMDKGNGKDIVDKWMSKFPLSTDIKGQKVQDADKGSLNELFKYTTKIIANKKGKLAVYIKPLNVILEALYKRRCFQPFGIVKMVSEDVDNLDSQVYEFLEDTEGGIIEWIWNECDWVCNKKTLSGYIPPDIEFNFVE